MTVLLAAGAADEASAAAAELGSLVEHFASDSVRASHARALGELALALDEWQKALPALRQAAGLWRELDVPYETARCSVLLATAYRDVGDDEAADLELESARDTFTRLGARHDLLAVQGMLRHHNVPSQHGLPGQHGLSPREVQVLRLIVQGLTNRAIGTELFLSERTVQRHVSNIFDKLGVTSRTQAATHAIDLGINSTAP